ncbi:Uncharacterised protein [Sphingobacterium mizutaii]|uniref:Uncharacterized protein n=1 Tax=Sphingobacterium mizutaii TaxID=1010 RepID=A0AAJ4XAM8_9SPHI|nr:hypothetical protein SAMN05192578_101607 [Sphingobacterium mizutaii]SNV49214.1 Uncharacterised protein [Sphingobacterium mizutaii]
MEFQKLEIVKYHFFSRELNFVLTKYTSTLEILTWANKLKMNLFFWNIISKISMVYS